MVNIIIVWTFNDAPCGTMLTPQPFQEPPFIQIEENCTSIDPRDCITGLCIGEYIHTYIIYMERSPPDLLVF